MSIRSEDDFDEIIMDEDLTFDDSDIENVLDLNAADNIITEDVSATGNSVEGEMKVIAKEDIPLALCQLEDIECPPESSMEKNLISNQPVGFVELTKNTEERPPDPSEHPDISTCETSTCNIHPKLGYLKEIGETLNDQPSTDPFMDIREDFDRDNKGSERVDLGDSVHQQDLQAFHTIGGNRCGSAEFRGIVEDLESEMPFEAGQLLPKDDLDTAEIQNYNTCSSLEPCESSELDSNIRKTQEKVPLQSLEGEGRFDEEAARLSGCCSQSANDADKGEIQQGVHTEQSDSIDSPSGETMQSVKNIAGLLSTQWIENRTEVTTEDAKGALNADRCTQERLIDTLGQDFYLNEKSTAEGNMSLQNDVSFPVKSKECELIVEKDNNYEIMEPVLGQGHHTTTSLSQDGPDGVVTKESHPTDPCGNIDQNQTMQNDGAHFFPNLEGESSTDKNVNNSSEQAEDTVNPAPDSSTHALLLSACGVSQAKNGFFSSDHKNSGGDKLEQVVVAGEDGFLTKENLLTTVALSEENRLVEEVLSGKWKKKNNSSFCSTEKASCVFEDLDSNGKEAGNFEVALSGSKIKGFADPSIAADFIEVVQKEEEDIGKVDKNSKQADSSSSIKRPSVRDKKNSWSFGTEPVLVADIVAHRLSQSLTYDDEAAEELKALISEEDIDEFEDDNIFGDEERGSSLNGNSIDEYWRKKSSDSYLAPSSDDVNQQDIISVEPTSCDNSELKDVIDNSTRRGLEVLSSDVIDQEKIWPETRDTTAQVIIVSGVLDNSVQGSIGHKDIPDDNREGIIAQLSGSRVAAAEDIIDKDFPEIEDKTGLYWSKQERGNKERSEKSTECGKRVSCSPSGIETCVINEDREGQRFILLVGETVVAAADTSLSSQQEKPAGADKPEVVNKQECVEKSNSEAYNEQENLQQQDQSSVCSNIYKDSVCLDEIPDQTYSEEGITQLYLQNEQGGVNTGLAYKNTEAFAERDTHRTPKIVCKYKSGSEKLSYHDNKSELSTFAVVRESTTDSLSSEVQQDFDKTATKTKQTDLNFAASECIHKDSRSSAQEEELLIVAGGDIAMEKKGKHSNKTSAGRTKSTDSNKHEEGWNMSMAEDEDFEVIDYEMEDVTLPRVRQGVPSCESLSAIAAAEGGDSSHSAATKTAEPLPRDEQQNDDDEDGFEILNFHHHPPSSSSEKHTSPPIHHDHKDLGLRSGALSPRSKYLETNLDSDFAGRAVGIKSVHYGKDKLTGDKDTTRIDEVINNRAISGAKVGVRKISDSSSNIQVKTERKRSDQARSCRPGVKGDEDFDSDVSEARQLISDIYGEAFKLRKSESGAIKSQEDVSKANKSFEYEATRDRVGKQKVTESQSRRITTEKTKSLSASDILEYNRSQPLQSVDNEKTPSERRNIPFVVEQYTIGQTYVQSEPQMDAEVVRLGTAEGDEFDEVEREESSEDVEVGMNVDSSMEKPFSESRVSNEQVISMDTASLKTDALPSPQVPSPKEDIITSSKQAFAESDIRDSFSSDYTEHPVSSPVTDNVFSSPEEITRPREKQDGGQEERQKRGRPRERRTVRDVKEAVRKLKGEPSSRKDRPHSYHGDEGGEEAVRSRSSSRRRYDWNTTHFFPDIHDHDSITQLDKRSDRASQYSLYLEEDWIRDQYYSPPQQQQPPQDNTKQAEPISPEMDFSVTAARPPSEYHRNRSLDASSSQEELHMMVNVQGHVETESSSDPGDRESPKVWKKSPLHVNKKKRKDRPLSQEIHYHVNGNGVDTSGGDPPVGAIPISRMGTKMGSPGSRAEHATRNLRGNNKRPNAPNMGTKVTPKKGGSTGTNGADIQQKYAKFEELQKRRRALESTSEESLVQPKPGSSVQDSLRRYNNKHRHPKHSEKTVASRKLFQSEEAIHEKISQEKTTRTENTYTATSNGGLERRPHETASIVRQSRTPGGLVSQTSLHSSSNDEANTNDFLMEMKKKLKSVRKSQEDLRYEKQTRGEAEGGAREILVQNVNTSGVKKGATMSPYKSATTSSSTSSQNLHSSPPQNTRAPGFKSQLDHISTETVSQSRLTDAHFHQDAISQKTIPEKHRTMSSSFENIYDGLSRMQPYSSHSYSNININRDHPQTQSPERYNLGKSHETDYSSSNPHFRSNNGQHLVSKEMNPRGSQGSLDGSGYGSRGYGERRSSGDSRTTPTSVTSEGQGSRKLDAKSLVLEEKKKFEAYKREYVRRMSSKESTSGDETKDSYHHGDTSPLQQQQQAAPNHMSPSQPPCPEVSQRPEIPPDEYDYVLRKIHHTRQHATVLEKGDRAQRIEEANAALTNTEPQTTGGQTQEQVNQPQWQGSESYLEQQKQKLQQRQKEAELHRKSVQQTEQPRDRQSDTSQTQQYVDVTRKFSFNEDDAQSDRVSDNREVTLGDNKGSYKEKTGHHLYSKSMSAIDSNAVFDQQESYHYKEHQGRQKSANSRRHTAQGADFRDNIQQAKDMRRDTDKHQQQCYPEGRRGDHDSGYYGTYPKNGQDYYDSVPREKQKERFPRGDYGRHSYHEGFDNKRPVYQKTSRRHEEQLRQEDYISKPQETIIADFPVSSTTKMPRDDYYSYKRKPEQPSYNSRDHHHRGKYQQQSQYPSQHHTDPHYQSHERRPQGSGDIRPYHEKSSSKKRQQGQSQGQNGSLPDFRSRKDLLKSWSETHIEQRSGDNYNWDQYNYKPEKYQHSAKDYLHYPDQGVPPASLEYPTQQRDAMDARGYPRYGNNNNSYSQANDAYPQQPSSQRSQQYDRPRVEEQYYRDKYPQNHQHQHPPVQQQEPYYRADDNWPDSSQRPLPQGEDQYHAEQLRNQAPPPKPARYQQQEPQDKPAPSHSNPIYDHSHDPNLQRHPHTAGQQGYQVEQPVSSASQQTAPAYQYAKVNPDQPNYSPRDRVDDIRGRSFQLAYSPNQWSPRNAEKLTGDSDRDRYVREYVPVENKDDNNATVGPIASVHVDSYFQPVNPNASFSQYSDATGSTASHMQQQQQQQQTGQTNIASQQYYPVNQEQDKVTAATTENMYQARYGDRPTDAYYQQYPPPPAPAVAEAEVSVRNDEMQQLEEETFSASREHRNRTNKGGEREGNTKPMREEDTYEEEFPPPPPPIEELVDFPQQDQEVFTKQLNDKLHYLQETDPRFRDYEDKVSQYIRQHKSQASNQYEAHVQQGRDSYRATHQADIQETKRGRESNRTTVHRTQPQEAHKSSDYVDPKTIRQRKEGFEDIYKKKLLRSRSLPRESATTRGREESPVRIRRGRDRQTDRPEERQETVFERKAKFTQSFRQSPDRKVSPDKTTGKKPEESDKRKSAPLPVTRHVLRPSRSAENLHQATADDMPKVSVLNIKERLFGPSEQKSKSSNAPPDLGRIHERKDRKVDAVKDVFSQKEEKVPTYSTAYKSKTGVIDTEQDELLYNIVSCNNTQPRRNINIFDDLTDLEITYAKLKRENGEDLPVKERYGNGNQMPDDDYDPTEPNVKRLSISNVRKFEELLQQRLDNSPKEEYTKQWIKKEKPEESARGERVRNPAIQKRNLVSASTDDVASVATSDDRRFSDRLSLPRKKADDMAFRKTHQIASSNSVTLQSLNLVGSYLPQPGKSSSLERVNREGSVPSTRKSRSPEKEKQMQVEVTVGSNRRDEYRNRDRISMKEARSKFISGGADDQNQDCRRSKGETEITVSIRKRAKSLDRNAFNKQEEANKAKSSLERSNSFGRGTDHKNLSKGVATMVMRFTSPKETSQSVPDLTKKSVFAGEYNTQGNLVSEDPKYMHAVKPKKLPSSTPRMIKMRSEMKSKFKGMKSSGDSGFYQEDESDSYSSSDQFHRQPPDGALCDSDEFDLAKVSDGSLEKDRGKGLNSLRAKFEVNKDSYTKKTVMIDSNSNNNNNGFHHGYSKTPPSPTMKTEMRVELTPPSARKVDIQAETRRAKETFLTMDQDKANPVRPSHIDLQNIKLKKVAKPEEGRKSDQPKPTDRGSPFATQISQLQYIDDVIASSMSTTTSSDQMDGSKLAERNKDSDESKRKFEFSREMLRKKDASPDNASKVNLAKPKAYPFGTAEEVMQKPDHHVQNVAKKITPVEITHGGLKAPSLDDIGSKFDEGLKVARAKLSGKISPSVVKEGSNSKDDNNQSKQDQQASTFEIQFSKPSAPKDSSKPIMTQISRASSASMTSQPDSPRIINISLSRNSSREGDISQTESEMSPNVKIERVSQNESQIMGKPQFSWSDSKTKVKVTPKPSGESRMEETRETRGFKDERENYSKEVSQVRVMKQRTTVHRELVKEPPQHSSSHQFTMVQDGASAIDKYGAFPMSPLKDLSDGEMTDATDITLDSMVRANLPTSYDPFSGFKSKPETDGSSVSSENSQKEYLITEGLERRPHTVRFDNNKDKSGNQGNVSASVVSHQRSSKSESCITTETSQSGTRTVEKETQSSQSQYKREVKKDLREERRLSLKERVQLFEDQAEPFMRKSKTHEN